MTTAADEEVAFALTGTRRQADDDGERDRKRRGCDELEEDDDCEWEGFGGCTNDRNFWRGWSLCDIETAFREERCSCVGGDVDDERELDDELPEELGSFLFAPTRISIGLLLLEDDDANADALCCATRRAMALASAATRSDDDADVGGATDIQSISDNWIFI